MRSLPRPAFLFAATSVVLALAACSQTVGGTPQAATGTPVTSPAPSSDASSATPPSPSPSTSVPSATFADCSQLLSIPGLKIPARFQGKLSAQCAHVPVPLNYADPNGRQLSITVVRFHDSDNTGSNDPLFFNPGGPGASGVEQALGLLTELPAKVLQNYDLLGFDPRGTELSDPVSCVSNAESAKLYAASPDLLTPAGFRAAKANAKTFADACEAKYGSALPYFNTVETANDMDRVRAAIGAHVLNYLGFSYGTELGSVYAHLFPGSVGAMVLDGAVDPLTSGIRQAAEQLQGFEGAFDQFAPYCRTHAPCTALPSPRATAEHIVTSTERTPLPTGTAQRLTQNLATTGILEAMYSRKEWPQLDRALTSASQGNGAGLLALAYRYYQRSSNGTYPNFYQAFQVISCNDTATGPSDPTIRQTARSWVHRFPLFGAGSTASLFGCQQWQPDRNVPPKPTAATATKVLVVGNLHDPATPFQGAKDLATTMGNAELLAWNGEGHTSYLEGSSCVDNYVDDYLISKTLPPQNTTCPK